MERLTGEALAQKASAASAAVARALLKGFRTATVLEAIETWHLRSALVAGAVVQVTSTQRRIIDAARALELVHGEPAQFAEPLRTAAASESEWRKILAVIDHQESYLGLARGSSHEPNQMPGDQFRTEPEAYAAFLRGVAASHVGHGHWLANLECFVDAEVLVDLAGGFGAYTLEWIRSRPSRTAILMDLPGLDTILPVALREEPRAKFAPLDFRRDTPLPEGHLYLIANALHLFDEWQRIVARVVSHMPSGSTLAIMEAQPGTSAGALFDLQVHLRSGCCGGLISAQELLMFHREVGLQDVKCMRTADENDVFEREYVLVAGEKS